MTTTISKSPVAIVNKDGYGYRQVDGLSVNVTSDSNAPVIAALLTTEEAMGLWSALSAHFLSNPPEGSEFAGRNAPRKPDPRRDRAAFETPRPGDEFPDVGYVRRMSALVKSGL